MGYELFEDKLGKAGKRNFKNMYSPYCDFIYYISSIHKDLRLAMRILKPGRPSHILIKTHGWHMNAPTFEYMNSPLYKDYLVIEADMRGRAYSEGKPDCNGWELYDVIDAVNYVREHYKEYISDSSVVYFEGGSGGGGNAYALVGKFPDFFAACTALCGISDYKSWYELDDVGEFRDEMDIWIGKDLDAYYSRSGINLIENLLTPIFIAHGETDIRVGIEHARNYVKRANKLGKDHLVNYLELKGVGTRAHWGNATDKELDLIEALSEENRRNNVVPINIPDKGIFVVGGYLVTKKFGVFLDSIDKMAVLEYDLSKDHFKLNYRGDYELKKFY